MSCNTQKDEDSTRRAVLVEDEDKEGEGDGSGDVADDEDSEVKESVGPGEGSEEDTSDGVVSDDGDDGTSYSSLSAIFVFPIQKIIIGVMR